MNHAAYEPSAVFRPKGLESNPSSSDRSFASSTASVSFKRSGSRVMTEAEEAEMLSQATAQAMSAARSIIMSGGTQSSALSTAKAAAKSVLMPKRGSGGASKPPRAPQQKGFFGRKKGRQQAEIIASMALVTVNSSMSQQGPVGLNQPTFDPSGVMLSRTAHSVLSEMSMEEDQLIRRTQTPNQNPFSLSGGEVTFSKSMNRSSADGADQSRSPSRDSVHSRSPTRASAHSRSPTRASAHSRSHSWASPQTKDKVAAYSQHPTSPSSSPKKGVNGRKMAAPAPTTDTTAPPQGSTTAVPEKSEPVHDPVLTSPPTERIPSPRPSSPTLSTIFRKKGRMSKKKKEAIVAAVVESTMSGQEEPDNKGNYFRKKEVRSDKGAPSTELPKMSRIPSEMPVPRSHTGKSNAVKADGKSKKTRDSSKKSGASRALTDDEHSISYSSSFSGTEDESESAHSYSIDANETHSHEYHETSDDETLSTNGGETKDISVEEKPSTWMDPFFASFTAALSCSPSKTTQNVGDEYGELTDDEEDGQEAALFPDDRDDEEVQQVNKKNLSVDSSLHRSDGETEVERETTPGVANDKPSQRTKKDTDEEKPVSMEQLVLRALAATISPSSNRPKLNLDKAPLPPKHRSLRNLPSRPIPKVASKLLSGHAMVKTMSKDREGLYSPPSVDPPPFFSKEQTPGLGEDVSISQSFPIESGETEASTDNVKKGAKIGWLRRKSGKTKGSF